MGALIFHQGEEACSQLARCQGNQLGGSRPPLRRHRVFAASIPALRYPYSGRVSLGGKRRQGLLHRRRPQRPQSCRLPVVIHSPRQGQPVGLTVRADAHDPLDPKHTRANKGSDQKAVGAFLCSCILRGELRNLLLHYYDFQWTRVGVAFRWLGVLGVSTRTPRLPFSSTAPVPTLPQRKT